MVIVLVSARYKTILSWLLDQESISHIGVIKQNGPKIYLYVESQLSKIDVLSLMNHVIRQKSGGMMVYSLYTIYNGKIDYNAYLSNETKNQMSYYQKEKKDISNEEIENYKRNLVK